MDNFIKNAAIYLIIKNEKEDNYFISQKINRIKESFKRKNVKIQHYFLVYKCQEENFEMNQYIMNQIKKNQIDLLIVEDGEDVPYLKNVGIEKVMIL